MKILGWTDEVNACDCCGKSEISGTFAIEDDKGCHVYYGSVCVKHAYGASITKAAAVDAELKALKDAWRWVHNSMEFHAFEAAKRRAKESGIVGMPAILKTAAVERKAYHSKRDALLSEATKWKTKGL